MRLIRAFSLALMTVAVQFAANPAYASDLMDVDDGIERSALTASSQSRMARATDRTMAERRGSAFGLGTLGAVGGFFGGAAVGAVVSVPVWLCCDVDASLAIVGGGAAVGLSLGVGAGAALGGGYAFAPSTGGAALGLLVAAPIGIGLAVPTAGVSLIALVLLPATGAMLAGSKFARNHELQVTPNLSADRGGLTLSGSF